MGRHDFRRIGEGRSCVLCAPHPSEAVKPLRSPLRAFLYADGEYPPEHVGSGPLDITLPVASPDYTDLMEIRAYGSPRLWVDLIQRQTGKLRWIPISPARVTFVRYDCLRIRSDHLAGSTKGLLDALKVRTSGRRDGIYLHYFGAIVDDAQAFVDVRWEQRLVSQPRDAGVRVTVLPMTANQTVQRTGASRFAQTEIRTSSAAGSRR